MLYVLPMAACITSLAGIAASVSAAVASPAAWRDASLPAAERAAKLLAAMNATEKLVLLQGASGPGIGNTAAIARLGVPAVRLEDGPNGVADWQINVTTWPSSMTMGATWDVKIAQEYGAACGAEQRGKGMQVMLGPGVNLARVPVGGRNFEYMGEDPHLAGQMAAAETKGIQSEGVVACAKHWADNNQEGPGHNGRLSTSSLVDDRANFELYYRNCSGHHKLKWFDSRLSPVHTVRAETDNDCYRSRSIRGSDKSWCRKRHVLMCALTAPHVCLLLMNQRFRSKHAACKCRQPDKRNLQLREQAYAY
jgi:hypothetical protein